MKKRNGTGNEGFSLVELLIAVTILAIIMIPLLHMFVSSARMNVKSRQKLQATTVAQDVMEGLKAFTLEEVRAQFVSPEEMGNTSYYHPEDGFYIVDIDMVQGGIRDLTEGMPDHVEGDEVYYFGIESIRMQEAEYDVLIRLDAAAYGSKAKDRTHHSSAVHDNEFNGRFYSEIQSVMEVNGNSGEAAKAMDSSYHQNKELDQDVLKDIKQQIEAYYVSVGEPVPDNLDTLALNDIIRKRLLKITIEDAGVKDAEGNGQCRATVTFLYEYEYGEVQNECTKTDCPYGKGMPGHTNPHSHGYAGSAGGEVYQISRTFSSGNFYLFYYPFYSTGTRIDYIEFEIKDKDKLLCGEQPLLKSIVLAKQIRSRIDTKQNVLVPELSVSDLWEKEKSYKAQVMIDTEGEIGADLIYRTNLGTNLADGSDIGMGMIDQFFDDVIHIRPCSFTGEDIGEKVTNVIYDIEISVYEAGAAKHFTESDFEEDDEVHKLATITNLSGGD